MVRDIAELRRDINDIDDRIVELIGKRMAIAEEVGDYKRLNRVPVRDYEREARVIEAMRGRAGEVGLDADVGEAVAKVLIRSAVERQQILNRDVDVIPKGISIIGPEGSSHDQVERKEVLVIGASGNMGSWFCEFFSSFGHSVIPADIEETRDDDTFGRLLRKADVVVVSVSLGGTRDMLERIIRLGTSALVFDVASLKSPFLDVIDDAKGAGVSITSIHPMFGPNTAFLANKNIILCDCDNDASARVRELFDHTAANLFTMPLREHDRYIVYVLGLSHFVNLLFSDVLSSSGTDVSVTSQLGGTTFNRQMDVTREVICDNPLLYYEIQKLNAETPRLMDEVRASLERIDEAVRNGEPGIFESIMRDGTEYLGSCMRLY